jgi:methionyl-tRNA synthetase
MLKELGYLYETEHKGWYCVSDETFYPESAVNMGINPITGKQRMVSRNKTLGKVIKN